MWIQKINKDPDWPIDFILGGARGMAEGCTLQVLVAFYFDSDDASLICIHTYQIYFRYEKLFSGHYIGDLARLVLLELTNQGLVFGGKATNKLKQWKSFTAEHLSQIER